MIKGLKVEFIFVVIMCLCIIRIIVMVEEYFFEYGVIKVICLFWCFLVVF